MRRALVGHTGFVGSNLKTALPFDSFFNSSNFRDMAGGHFDLLVCAATPAVKWYANAHPAEDRAAIAALLDVLDATRIERMVLISTIDVYPDPSRPLDESAQIDPAAGQPYGRHRLEAERWVRERFERHHVVRLPALFGPGLKKNALYDLLHDNQVEKINPASVFQWYPVTRLAQHLTRIIEQDLPLVNLFPAPLPTRRLLDGLFPRAPVGPAREPAPVYGLRTRYAPALGGSDGYVMAADDCYRAIATYVASFQEKQA